MVRFNSCRGREFAPYFGATLERDGIDGSDGSASESSADDDDEGESDSSDSRSNKQNKSKQMRGSSSTGDLASSVARGGSSSSLGGTKKQKDVWEAFADARDRWKIDARTLKGFYLHSVTGNLYSWNQARGLLYHYNPESGECVTIWAATTPQVNAEIWTVLPLPPTDPASMQAASPPNNPQTLSLSSPAASSSASPSASGSTHLCMLHFTRLRAKERARDAAADFRRRLSLNASAMAALEELPLPAQAYVLKTFCAPRMDVSGALTRQVKHLQELASDGPESCPWYSFLETCTLRVPATGAVLGSCVPDLAAMCWGEGDLDALAAAHCRVAYVDGRFRLCNLVGNTVKNGDDDEHFGADGRAGTWLGGRRLGNDWAELNHNDYFDIGPLRARTELVSVNSVEPSDGDTIRSEVQRGGWRKKKKSTGDLAASPQPTKPADSPPRQRDDSESPARTAPHRALSKPSNGFEQRPKPPVRARSGFRLEHLEEEDGDETSKLRGEPESDDVFGRPAVHVRAPRAQCRAFWAAPRSPSRSPRRSNGGERDGPAPAAAAKTAKASSKEDLSWVPKTPSRSRSRSSSSPRPRARQQKKKRRR